MAGDHAKGLDGLFETIALLENSGVSAIEVGIPWSDPVADGPVIELAGQRSLAKGVTLTAIIKKLQEQKTQVPLVIMTYINPVYQSTPLPSMVLQVRLVITVMTLINTWLT